MLPNVTNTNGQTGVEPYKTGVFDAYLSFCALGGIITEDDGSVHKMSLGEFCLTYDVTRMTLNRWKKQTPNWAELVERRRNEIMPLARVTAVWNSVYVLARQTQDKRAAVEAAKLFLGHNGLTLPIQRQDVQMHGDFLDMMAAAAKEGIIDGEIVHADNLEPQTDTSGSDQNTGALPTAS